MDILKQILNFIIGLLAPKKKDVIKLSAKKRALKSLDPVLTDSYIFTLSGMTYEILPSSWSSARSSGKTIKEVLNTMTNKSFKLLDMVGKNFNKSILKIGITSLWRDGNSSTNVHTLGRGLDIGYLVFRDSGQRLKAKPYKHEPPIFQNLRSFVWSTGLLWQWIGPNKIIDRRGPNWASKENLEKLSKAHYNHVHLTISK